ncbi:hypothetical protein F5Y17DRAFT_452239 [Xylariaceae sp. FL0594]|nr:hypothetical protein F5Y17DRAFT_452239 [Xylariaceae sp. FL0594]
MALASAYKKLTLLTTYLRGLLICLLYGLILTLHALVVFLGCMSSVCLSCGLDFCQYCWKDVGVLYAFLLSIFICSNNRFISLLEARPQHLNPSLASCIDQLDNRHRKAKVP